MSKYWTAGQPGFEPPKAYSPTKTPSYKYTWMEPKIDGARALVHLYDGQVVITSRRKNKDGIYRQWQDNLVHFRDGAQLQEAANMGYTILDGELIMPDSSSIMSVIGANPDVAAAKQEEHGHAQLVLFDTPVINGVDISGESLATRRMGLNWWIDTYKVSNIQPIEKHEIGANMRQAAIDMFIAEGYEGAVLKNPESAYFAKRAWYKYKKTFTIDAMVTGYMPGKGKYTGMVGALRMSVYDTNNERREICNVAPGSDADRLHWQLWFDNLNDPDGPRPIIELECQEWGAQQRLRHPRIKRRRPDKATPNVVNFSVNPPEVA